MDVAEFQQAQIRIRHLQELLTAVEKKEGARDEDVRRLVLPLLEEATRDRPNLTETLRKFYRVWPSGRRETEFEEEWLTAVFRSLWRSEAELREEDFCLHEGAVARTHGRPWRSELVAEAGVLCTALMRAWGTREVLLRRMERKMEGEKLEWNATTWGTIGELLDLLWNQ